MSHRLVIASSLALALAATGCVAEDDGPERSQRTTSSGTCSLRCGDYDADQTCQCDADCDDWGDCCEDFVPECVGCVYAGARHPVDSTFPAGDGCNTCMCASPGVVACTEMSCEVCEYDGGFYLPGEHFRTADGCNSCTCTADGQPDCTALPCGG